MEINRNRAIFNLHGLFYTLSKSVDHGMNLVG